ncbi:DUF3667 domain-containing protein [Microbulbifer litoralis]|uniref:DUF3667 domain-containing protein n=1 Tax=Microbulbifer litoralis TaxID=2933965 RepID=UPI003CE50FCC
MGVSPGAAQVCLQGPAGGNPGTPAQKSALLAARRVFLIARPGCLSREYVARRRVRYASPVRLFVFLCLTVVPTVQITAPIRQGANSLSP